MKRYSRDEEYWRQILEQSLRRLPDANQTGFTQYPQVPSGQYNLPNANDIFGGALGAITSLGSGLGKGALEFGKSVFLPNPEGTEEPGVGERLWSGIKGWGSEIGKALPDVGRNVGRIAGLDEYLPDPEMVSRIRANEARAGSYRPWQKLDPQKVYEHDNPSGDAQLQYGIGGQGDRDTAAQYGEGGSVDRTNRSKAINNVITEMIRVSPDFAKLPSEIQKNIAAAFADRALGKQREKETEFIEPKARAYIGSQEASAEASRALASSRRAGTKDKQNPFEEAEQEFNTDRYLQSKDLIDLIDEPSGSGWSFAKRRYRLGLDKPYAEMTDEEKIADGELKEQTLYMSRQYVSKYQDEIDRYRQGSSAPPRPSASASIDEAIIQNPDIGSDVAQMRQYDQTRTWHPQPFTDEEILQALQGSALRNRK